MVLNVIKQYRHEITLAVIATLLLLGFRSLHQMGDALGFAYEIKHGQELFSAHHLLYGPIVFIIHRFLSLFIPGIDVILTAQLHNIFWAVVMLIAFYRWCLKTFDQSWAALLCSLCLLFSFQFWTFSTQVEVYIPSLALMVVLSAYLFNLSKPPNLRSSLLISLIWFGAVIYHQNAVLFIFPMAYLFGARWGKQGWSSFLKLCISAGGITLLAYCIVYLATKEYTGIQGLIDFALGYAISGVEPDWGTWQHFSNTNEVRRAFFNQIHTLLARTWVEKLPLWLMVTGMTGLYFWHFAFAIKGHLRSLRMFLLIWLLTSQLFLLWWTPGYELFVLLTTPFLMLVIMAIWDITSRLITKTDYAFPITLIVFTLGLLAFNAPAFYHQYTHRSHAHAYAQLIDQELPEDGQVITDYGTSLHLRYYFGRSNIIQTVGLCRSYYVVDSILPIYQLAEPFDKTMYLWHFNPWYDCYGHNGMNDPQGWYDMTKVLFGFQLDSTDALVAAHTPTIILEPTNGWNLLFISKDRATVNGAEGFFTILDAELVRAGLAGEAIYSQWWREHKDQVDP